MLVCPDDSACQPTNHYSPRADQQCSSTKQQDTCVGYGQIYQNNALSTFVIGGDTYASGAVDGCIAACNACDGCTGFSTFNHGCWLMTLVTTEPLSYDQAPWPGGLSYTCYPIDGGVKVPRAATPIAPQACNACPAGFISIEGATTCTPL